MARAAVTTRSVGHTSDAVVYRLDDRPPIGQSVLAAVQHLLAMFAALVAPTLIIAGPLRLDDATTNHLLRMALIVSGVATAIQARRLGPIGSGLLSVQGTSFSFIGPLIATGTAVTLIGLSLIGVGMVDLAGGADAQDFGSLRNLALGGLVIATIVYGLDVDLALFVPVAFIFVITTIESTGDMTATSIVSDEPVDGDVYIERIRGGLLGDGVNSAIAAVFTPFPNVTFSQNNGVIQLTGVASRFVGYFVAGLLVRFGAVAAAGIKIITSAGDLNRRDLLILAVSFGRGLGVELVPDAVSQLPVTAQVVFSSAITTGGLTALLLDTVLPHDDDPTTRS